MKDYGGVHIQHKETSSATTLIRSQMDIRIWQQSINLYGLKQSSKYANGKMGKNMWQIIFFQSS